LFLANQAKAIPTFGNAEVKNPLLKQDQILLCLDLLYFRVAHIENGSDYSNHTATHGIQELPAGNRKCG
jgi:hypothetical protein